MKNIKIIIPLIIFVLTIIFHTEIAFVSASERTTSKPYSPTNVKAVSTGYNSVKITWGSVPGASGYQISRSASKTGTYKVIIDTTSTSYTNTNLVTAKNYYYKVQAYQYIGTTKVYSPYSTVVCVNPIPSIPTNFIATRMNSTSIKVSWKSVSGATGYQVSRSTSKTGTYKNIKTTTSTYYTNSGLTEGNTYYYKVRAYRMVGTKKVYGKFTAIISTTLSKVTNKTKVVGYYAAWSAYSGFTPDEIDASKLTHINYAFANIGSDLKIEMGYPDIDPSNFKKLNALKKLYPNLKTIISVGGWSWSKRFSNVALTEVSRTNFAESCVDFIVKNGFDGVDLDWEYPVGGGLSTNVSRPADKQNFTLLMKILREKLDARGKIDGKHYILTYAGASTDSYINNTEPQKLQQYVDYVNVMTYDIHGNWDKYTDFNAPLYKNCDATLQYKGSVDESINSWLAAGFPANKIVMGVPFYGYVYKSVTNCNNGLYQTYSGCSSISYQNIVGNYLNKLGYVRYFHKNSMIPWLFNGSTFISYEDEQSIGLKADYIKSKGLGGAMIWELSHDPSGVLLKSLYNELK